nr:ECF transporter S component [uncultured Sellimonas sp.]
MLLGARYGLGVGIIVPVLSSMLTGMPPVPKVYFMIFELAAYGLVSGILAQKKYPVYLRLIPAMIAGRIIYGCTLMVAVYLLHFRFPFANGAAFVSGIVTGLPGIAIQLIVIPILYRILKQAGFTFEE